MSGGFEPWSKEGGGSGDGGILSFATVGSAPSSSGATVSGTVATLQPADATHPGLVTTGAQTFAGNKAFPDQLAFYQLVATTAGNFLTLAAAPYATYSVFGASRSLLNFVTNAAGDSLSLPSNVGFPFPATLAPSGTTQTVDWTIGSSQRIDASSTTGTLVLTFTFPTDGGRYVLKTIGKTARTWTFPASVKWAGGVAPTVTATDGAIDMFEFYYDAGDSTYVGRVVAQNVS